MFDTRKAHGNYRNQKALECVATWLMINYDIWINCQWQAVCETQEKCVQNVVNATSYVLADELALDEQSMHWALLCWAT